MGRARTFLSAIQIVTLHVPGMSTYLRHPRRFVWSCLSSHSQVAKVFGANGNIMQDPGNKGCAARISGRAKLHRPCSTGMCRQVQLLRAIMLAMPTMAIGYACRQRLPMHVSSAAWADAGARQANREPHT